MKHVTEFLPISLFLRAFVFICRFFSQFCEWGIITHGLATLRQISELCTTTVQWKCDRNVKLGIIINSLTNMDIIEIYYNPLKGYSIPTSAHNEHSIDSLIFNLIEDLLPSHFRHTLLILMILINRSLLFHVRITFSIRNILLWV